MGAKSKIKTQDGPLTDWYESEAWFTEQGEQRVISGKLVEILGAIEDVPVVQTDGSLPPETVREIAASMYEATGEKPLVINGPIQFVRFRRLRQGAVDRIRKRIAAGQEQAK